MSERPDPPPPSPAAAATRRGVGDAEHAIDQPARWRETRGAARVRVLVERADHHLFPPRGLVDGNHATLLVDGVATYPAMLRALHAAQRSIVMETYILADDLIGWRFADALIGRARAGVAVHLTYDALGSISLGEGLPHALREAGVRLHVFRPLAPWRPRWGWQRRNHRKLLVVDRAVAFAGGLNIAREYAPAAWGGLEWRDTHMQLRGPIIDALARLMLDTWREETGQRIDLDDLGPPPAVAGDMVMRFLSNHRVSLRHQIHRAYLRAIRRARRRVWISNAYFSPDLRLVRALEQAARRGVDVRLVLQGKSDVYLVRHAGRAVYQRLLRAGVRIYEWLDRILHTKTAVIDSVWTSIGSYNLDHLSMHTNLEDNVVVLDRAFAAAVEDAFCHDIARCVAIDPHTWGRRPLSQRALERLAQPFLRFL